MYNSFVHSHHDNTLHNLNHTVFILSVDEHILSIYYVLFYLFLKCPVPNLWQRCFLLPCLSFLYFSSHLDLRKRWEKLFLWRTFLFCFLCFFVFLALFYDDCFSNMKFIILNFAAVFLFFCFPLFLVTPSPIDPLSVRPSSSLFFLSPALFSNTLLISRVMVQMFYIIISN